MKTLYRAARVRTLAHPETGEWLVIDGRHVQRIGSGEPPTADRIVDLPGATIVPGFVDAHVHLTTTGLSLANEDVASARSADELLAAIQRRTAQEEGSETVFLLGYDESRWDRPELPTMAQLDSASARPLIVRRVDGHAALDFVSHYYPNVLEAMRTRWISPQFVSTNRVDSVSDYDDLRELGQRVVEALGIGTSATHMEWFFGSKGLRFSEIGCRPPGVGAWDLYSAGNDLDLYREWANAIVHGHVATRPSRRFATGIIALRPERDGTISGYSGVDEMQAKHGEWVLDAHLPHPGTPTQPVEAGYMANAYVRMRHPDYDALRGMLDEVGRTIHVHVA